MPRQAGRFALTLACSDGALDLALRHTLAASAVGFHSALALPTEKAQ